MNSNTVSQSQLIFSFGPGSMVDLPDRSVVVGGLDHWHIGPETKAIIEPRLSYRISSYLQEQGIIDEAVHLPFRSPPVVEDGKKYKRGIISPVFPKWFVCEKPLEDKSNSENSLRRQIVRWEDLDANKRRYYYFEDGSKTEVTPIRFVGACDRGHLQDIDWKWVIHKGEFCAEPMWLEDRGTSADPADTRVICGCGKQISLRETFRVGSLGRCQGQRPWLLDEDPEGCTESLKLLTRTATHTYFPQVQSVISLPKEEDELTGKIRAIFDDLDKVNSEADLESAKRFNPRVENTLGDYPNDQIFASLQRSRESAVQGLSHSPKIDEFDVLAIGEQEIGLNNLNSELYARTLPRAEWEKESLPESYCRKFPEIKNLVAVHRLREVTCLYGFTRFAAAPSSAEGYIEDVPSRVVSAPISKDLTWLPAIEQFGEGLFIHFDEEKIIKWANKREVGERIKLLTEVFNSEEHNLGVLPENPSVYTLLHSLSHALMAEISLDCGYPASSLKERVYALSGMGGRIARCGILIYTSTTGSQGTLGGLVSTAERFSRILTRLLDKLKICSNDPICADHEPHGFNDGRATHGAACHGCLLAPETSCEMRNLFLDRSLLVKTIGGGNSNFFV